MKKKRNKGFTLIELLVVVAIIGILASVGVVAYNGYTESAKKASAGSNHNSVKKWIQNEIWQNIFLRSVTMIVKLAVLSQIRK